MKRLLLPVLLCSLFACQKDTTPDPVDPPVPDKKATTIKVWDATQWSGSNPKGLPIEGATVQLYATQQDYTAKKIAYTATTDKNGIASFTDAKDGEYFIVAFKDKKTNTWDDGQGHTKVSDTLFQSDASVNDPQQPIQKNAAPGDFMFRDLNGDGQINNNDIGNAPFFKVTINNTTPVAASTIIGYAVNHEGAPLTTIAEVKTSFAEVAQQVGITHNGFVMLDGMLGDEVDVRLVEQHPDWNPDWKKIDAFEITVTNAVTRGLWNDQYANILKLNKLLADATRLAPEEAAVPAQIRMFRALAYLDLFRYYGPLPVVEGTVIPTTISRRSKEATKDYINKDIQDAFSGLPLTAPTETPWYATKGAAYMLQAKLFVETGDYEGCTIATNMIITNKIFTLSPTLEPMFSLPASPETIWYINSNLKAPFKDYFIRLGQQVDLYPVYRFTDTYLLQALGFALQNKLELVTESLRPVAERTGGDVAPIYSREDAFNEIDVFYSSQFYREGIRYRFLHLTHQTSRYLDDLGYDPHFELMPIPDSVLMKYPNITQNVGY